MKKVSQQACSSCGEVKKCRHRDFSSHAWAILLHWEEIDSSVIGQPLCNDCYNELRELLIDRAEEMEEIMAQGLAQDKHAAILAGLSAMAGEKSLPQLAG